MKTVINATHIDHHGQRTSCELTVDHDVTGRVAELLARGMLAELGMFPPKPAGEVVITVDEHRDGGDSVASSMRVHELADALGVGSGTLRDYLGAESVMTRLSDLVSLIAASDGVERSQLVGDHEKVVELTAWIVNNVAGDDFVAGEHSVDVAIRLLEQHYRKPTAKADAVLVALPTGWTRLDDDSKGPRIEGPNNQRVEQDVIADKARLMVRDESGIASSVEIDAVRAYLALHDGPTEPLTGSFRHFASALFGAMAKHCRTSCDRFIGETTFERWAADAVSDSPSSRTAHDLIIEAKRRAGAGDTPVAVHDKPKRTRDDFPPGSLVRVLSVADDDDPPVGTVLRVSGLVAYNNDPFVRVFWGGDEHKHGEYPLHVSQIEPVAEKLERVNVVLGRGVPSDAGCYARTHIYGHGLAVNICGTGPGWMRKLAGQPNELTILIEDCDVKPGVDVLFVRELSIDGKTVGSPVDFDQWLAGLAVRQSDVSSKP